MTPPRILVVAPTGPVEPDLPGRLGQLGYEVVQTAVVGAEVVPVVRALRPDLVLVHLGPERADAGISAAGQIRAALELPVVFLAGDGPPDPRALAAEPFGYLFAPYPERELAAALAVALDRHRTERRLRQGERRYAAALSGIREAVLTVGGGGTVQFLNAAAAALTGWPGADAVGRPLDEVIVLRDPATGQPRAAPIGAALARDGLAELPTPVLLRDRQGAERLVEVGAAPLREADGGAVLAFRDVTERRQLEDQLRLAQKMEAVGQLAGGIAHDFNNLLTAILGFSEIILQKYAGEQPWRPLLEEVHRAGQRAAELTRQLLVFSRRQPQHLCVLDLNELLGGVGRLLARLLGEDVRITTRLAPGLPPVRVDPSHLEQVIVNLATNARDAMPGGGELTFETGLVAVGPGDVAEPEAPAPGPYVALTVTDTGTGMPPEVQRRIFEPFFTTKEVGKGTGLGLAVVYGLIKQFGGHVRVSSQVGRGTAFTLLLPPAQDPAAGAAPANALQGLPAGTETLLVVEDEEAVRRLAGLVLRGCGYQVLEAGNGADALQVSAAHAGLIHLLITDVVMPQMNGPQLSELLRRQRPDLRVLFVTGYMEHGAGPYPNLGRLAPVFQKPFSPRLLALKVREILDQPAPAGERGA